MTTKWDQEIRDFYQGKSEVDVQRTIPILQQQWVLAHEELTKAEIVNPVATRTQAANDDIAKKAEELARVEAYINHGTSIIQQNAQTQQAANPQGQPNQQAPAKQRKWPKRLLFGSLAASALVFFGNKGQQNLQDPPGFDPSGLPPTTVEPLTEQELEEEFCDLNYGMGGALADGSLWESQGSRAKTEETLRAKLEKFNGERACDSTDVEEALQEGMERVDETIANYGIDDSAGSRSLISCENDVVTEAEHFGKPNGVAKGANCPVRVDPGEIVQTPDLSGVVLGRDLG